MDILNELGKSPAASDSDLVAALFGKFGPDLVHRIDGDYALAIYDTTSRKLYLIRDHIGTRPLYWRRHRGSVIFGTDVRSLTKFSDLPWQIDERAVARFVIAPNRAPEKTMFEGTRSGSARPCR